MTTSNRYIPGANSYLALKALSLGAAASVLLAGTAHAEKKPQAFEMATYTNGPGGESLAQGDYVAAIEEIRGGKPMLESGAGAISTNLCVAYSMTRQWDVAQQACDAAVSEAKEERLHGSQWSASFSAQQNNLAMAYVNRAVMRWMMQDLAAAASDLAMASKLAPKADFVQRNLAALNAKTVAAAPVDANVVPPATG